MDSLEGSMRVPKRASWRAFVFEVKLYYNLWRLYKAVWLVRVEGFEV